MRNVYLVGKDYQDRAIGACSGEKTFNIKLNVYLVGKKHEK